ncbi:P-loop containing nucleoside triphosphate hydrolase protein [Cucurbitaria berberidis CBS 394.84]|uniref:P-loop containing nucleoside triphosphate hydrolase protein n=1 Tax=Cucurbitaria berberidis CBS 394.84 TaxID=1168544 RepID=A0A9P4L9M6_9PLEO|nr:P-loop containing nucleoside triphosphate hydrolase protein [Cucurbitaria berberidis CBS 394.84]KAF1847386.1 P-loop containing nucleoside triphosphate hydrolase protein [Cucurbitaria berberidis CBS 394.84]
MCNESLSGLSEEAASIHVNGCIDAAPSPVEEENRNNAVQAINALPASEISWSEFLENIESFKGIWACNACKSDTLQPISDKTCNSCGLERDYRCPSSKNDFQRQPFDRYWTLLTSLNLSILDIPDGSVVRRKILLLGDTLCGKTFLASAWSQDKTPVGDTPLVNNFVKKMTNQGRQVELAIWDNTGMDGYERLRRLSYEDVHVVLICFDIAEPDSLENIEHMWNIEADSHLKDVRKILVGCKKDLRHDEATLARLHQHQAMPISPYAADKLAIKIHALAYFETSAVERKGITDLFDYVAEAALSRPHKTKTSGLRRFLSRGDIKLPSLSGHTVASS